MNIKKLFAVVHLIVKNFISRQTLVTTNWQIKALLIDPDGDIQEWFPIGISDLLEQLSWFPKRFVPMMVGDAEKCAYCGNRFNWDDPNTKSYIVLPAVKSAAKVDFPEISLGLSETVVCHSCQQKMLKRYMAMNYTAKAALGRISKDVPF